MSNYAACNFRELIDQDRDRIIELLGAPANKRLLWHWQFRPSSRLSSVVALSADGDVIGHNGVMPAQLAIDGLTEQAAWSCDFIVDPAFRGHSIGKQLKRMLELPQVPLLAFGISNAANHVHRSLGWKQIQHALYALVKRRSASGPKQAALLALQAYNRVKTSGLSASPGLQPRVGPLTLERARSLAGCWERTRPTWGAAVDRDLEYLKWRYVDNPVAAYDCIWLEDDNGDCTSALIVRKGVAYSAIVDFVGARHHAVAKFALVREAIRALADAPVIHCRTSDEEIRQAMLKEGAYEPRGANLRFSIWEPENSKLRLHERKWLLMAGDSDGEMLESAADRPALAVKRLSEPAMYAISEQWDELLSQSRADPLFLSWTWITAWWSSFSKQCGLSLFLLAVYDGDDELVGLAPLYRQRGRLGYRPNGSRIQFIGNIWQGPATVRSEYLEFIMRSGYEREASEAIFRHLRGEKDWDDLVLADIPEDSMTAIFLSKAAVQMGYLRKANDYEDPTYVIDCRNSFNAYVDQLGRTTRRRLFGSAKALRRRHGAYTLDYASAGSYSHYLDELNTLHRSRWGKPVFRGSQLAFINKVCAHLVKTQDLHLTRLVIRGRTESVLLNVRVNNRLYNIQAGFNPSFDNRIPLGYVHLGLQIRACFESDIDFFDLLAGAGKNTNFKKAFAAPSRNLTILQLIRSPLRQLAYRVRDSLADN